MSSIRKFSRFALNMFGAGFLNKLTENIDKLIIGKLFASAQLGFFERAKQFKDLAGQPLGGVFSKVMFPVFSNLQNDNERFLAGYRKTIRVVALLVIPVFFGLIVVAKPLIVFLITDKWLFSAKLLQILATSGFSYPLSAIMVIAIAAKGRADIFFKLDIAKTALCITSILIGSLWGIIGVAVAIAAAGYLGIYINIYAISKLMKLPVIEQFKDMGFPMIISAVMLLVLSAVANFGELTYINQLVILPIAGTMFYIGCTYFFDRSRFAEVRGMSMELGA
jgi:teichuronic acid exporter